MKTTPPEALREMGAEFHHAAAKCDDALHALESEADACESELNEMGDGCKIPGACPKCEAMVRTVAQYKADRCVI